MRQVFELQEREGREAEEKRLKRWEHFSAAISICSGDRFRCTHIFLTQEFYYSFGRLWKYIGSKSFFANCISRPNLLEYCAAQKIWTNRNYIEKIQSSLFDAFGEFPSVFVGKSQDESKFVIPVGRERNILVASEAPSPLVSPSPQNPQTPDLRSADIVEANWGADEFWIKTNLSCSDMSTKYKYANSQIQKYTCKQIHKKHKYKYTRTWILDQNQSLTLRCVSKASLAPLYFHTLILKTSS